MCFHPLNAWLHEVEKNGVKKRAVFFSPPNDLAMPIQLPCGKCLGCRMDKARTWAIRCLHESQMHEDNCFLTLTFSDDNLHDLDKRDLQLFFKRLRKALNGKRISYYAVGEYGSLTARPHYHALVFGWFPSDAYYWTGNGPTSLFRSSFLETLWPFGNSLVGSVSYESACYVSRYCAKALGSGGFALMSRNPAIGKDWYRRYGPEVSAHDGCHIPSTDCFVRPPRYYDGLSDPDDLLERKARRLAYSVKAHAHDTVSRLLDREESLRLRLERKARIGEFDAFE
ncbi:replication initiator protein [Chimpanzee faeces associated microphage 3]|uniref:replication initiator protein n=1 Tax=Chimpanzee faeces associated microphage 3 TaxID=1676183 RepID=UPI0007FB697E|nr:replication initiator protein [Chimpanzee faeces associated microphage 3]AKO71498.1 replication initiator protein [Chimpanzee faeces associated microphage 3]